MYKQETIKPYSADGEKSRQVERMFDNIAPTYDLLNHRLSWNIDRYWRSRAINTLAEHMRKAGIETPDILDVATGTGDLAILTAKKIPHAHVTGADISEGMLNVARRKAEREALALTFEREDCCALSYPDNHFDGVMAAFGIRNFQNLELGLGEMYRVMKPGGIFCVLELTTPVVFPVKQMFALYSRYILPLYGRHISHDSAAYSYLNKTIEAFPQGEKMMSILGRTGFNETKFSRLTFGICTLYVAIKKY